MWWNKVLKKKYAFLKDIIGIILYDFRFLFVFIALYFKRIFVSYAWSLSCVKSKSLHFHTLCILLFSLFAKKKNIHALITPHTNKNSLLGIFVIALEIKCPSLIFAQMHFYFVKLFFLFSWVVFLVFFCFCLTNSICKAKQNKKKQSKTKKKR